MGNITSSHDQFRFAGYADGQINMSDNGIARSFENPVGEIQQLSTYKKLANFHAFNLSQPGIPIIYYGEEIALMGEGDPGNRRMMNFDLNNYQIELKKIFSDLNALRQKYPSLALGDQVIIKNEGPILVILKKYFDETILIGINNSPDSKQVNIEHPIKMNSIKLLFGSGNYVINNKKISLTIPPYSSVFYLGDRVR
jgi:glycosidase